jgi:hypothetical protein
MLKNYSPADWWERGIMLNPSEWTRKTATQDGLCQLSQQELMNLGYYYSVYQMTKNCTTANGDHYYQYLGSADVLRTSRQLFKTKREALAFVESNRSIYGTVVCRVKKDFDIGVEEL